MSYLRQIVECIIQAAKTDNLSWEAEFSNYEPSDEYETARIFSDPGKRRLLVTVKYSPPAKLETSYAEINEDEKVLYNKYLKRCAANKQTSVWD